MLQSPLLANRTIPSPNERRQLMKIGPKPAMQWRIRCLSSQSRPIGDGHPASGQNQNALAKTGTEDCPENSTSNSTENSVKIRQNPAKSGKSSIGRNRAGSDVSPCNIRDPRKASDRIRTDDVQLGKLLEVAVTILFTERYAYLKPLVLNLVRDCWRLVS